MRTSARTTKGQDTRVKLAEEQAAAQQQPEKAPSVRKPKANKEPKKTLDLDLSNVPPSNDPKFSKDWGEWDNKFWQTYFYTPDDSTTEMFIIVSDAFNDSLPAPFRLIKGEKEAYGAGNLELKPEYVKPIKRTPLLSKLEAGEYQIASSNSDKNIAATIKFFRNNLPSFKQYKDSDDISWVIHEHRLLVVEILMYYGKRDTPFSLATIKSRFNAITRIFRIAYETKNYPLYEKYSTLVIFLSQQFEADEFDNTLSWKELKKFVGFGEILNKQSELQKQFELIKNKNTRIAYDLNQDLLLVSLYSLIPPLRAEPLTLKFTTQTQRKEDWIVIKPDMVQMDLNEIKKKHDAILFNLTDDAPELAKILRESYELYPREFVFTHYKKYPDVSNQASVKTLTQRLTSIFRYTGKQVGINALRSSYISTINHNLVLNGQQMTVNMKEKLAYRMRTSRKYLDEAYLKLFPLEQIQQINQEPKENVVQPVSEDTPIERQNKRTKQYYEQNKEKVLAQQKEYQNKKPLEEKARAKMLYYLNSDPDYHNKIRPATQAKYNFQKVNGKWV